MKALQFSALFALCLVAACSAEPAAPAIGEDAAADAAVDVPADVTEAVDVAAEVTVALCPGAPGCDCADASECDDGDPCTAAQECVNEACTTGAFACDDANICTSDACDTSGKCSHSGLSGGACEDGSPCTISDTCNAGKCSAGKAKTCSDGNPCTDDVCQLAIGCVYIANEQTCTAENACATESRCNLGHCSDSAAKPCDDGSACTWDVCMPESGCTSLAIPNAGACTDTTYDGQCWIALKTAKNWNSARESCHSWGGELASVRSAPENVFARQLADGGCGKVDVWLGGSDHAQEGHWRWLNGTAKGYNNWADGEPNNLGGIEDYLGMHATGFWYDDRVDGLPGCAICARPLIPGCDDDKACISGAICQSGTCMPGAVTTSCDDGNLCTADSCTPGSGCAHVHASDGTTCDGGTCSGGVCWNPHVVGSEKSSCLAILASAPTATDGVFWIDVDGSGPTSAFQTWCDMHSAGGGWTLALQVDGTDPQSAYDGPIWTQPKPLPGQNPLVDFKSAVLPSAWMLPVKEVRVGLYDPTIRWLTVPIKAASLQQIFVDGKEIPTELGMPAWQTLLSDGSLQSHCQIEGFNRVSASTSIRIGIQGNEQNDCSSVDSWIGLGAKSGSCGQDKVYDGNVACWYPDKGDKAKITYGVVLVR